MSRPSKQSESVKVAGKYSYQGLDRVLHEKARLGILASLAANTNGLLFNDLKQFCTLTDGNLSRHLGVLSDAGLVEVWKGHAGARPQTLYRLTKSGRDRFSEYLQLLERIVLDAQIHQQASPSPKTNSIGGVSPA
ncbi:MAG: transcriptional regulator [Rubripirellula sp.]|nr:transcriptional regulator [Rubripirellula sp.]